MGSIDNFNYPVFLGEEIFVEIKKFISSGKFSSVFILTDENVNKYCLPVLLDRCKNLESAFLIEIPSGEDEKNISVSARIISVLLENNADRKCLVINLGGGVISDIGGFVSSVYKRGVSFINIPTTLLSMVDASIGGKNGVNFLDKKNIIGTFSNPSAIFIYPGFLKTLSKREVRSGYAEILKHILLSDSVKWNSIQKNPDDLLNENNIEMVIQHSVKFKSEITKEDFREENKRKILNFGHTIGHALEGFSISTENPLRHGEAVAAGMMAELFLSNQLTGFPAEEMNSSVQFIKNIFSDINMSCLPEDLIPFLYADKKNANDRIAFSLLKAPGVSAGIIYPDLEKILDGMTFMIDQFSRTVVQ